MNRRTVLQAIGTVTGYGLGGYGDDGYGASAMSLPEDLPLSMDRVEVRYTGDGRIKAIKLCEYDPDERGNICQQYTPE